MDCYPVDEKGNEVIEIKSKPIPEFMKNKTIGMYVFWIFISFLFIYTVYWIGAKFFFNNLAETGDLTKKK